MCTKVVADSADDVSSIQVSRVPLRLEFTEVIVNDDTSGNSSLVELLWRSTLTEFVSIGVTKEVTLREETVLVLVMTPSF